MSKYIDADKLIAEIERRKKQDVTFRERSILIDIETAITSLQQEQPKKSIEINGIRYKEVPAKTDDKICKDCDYFLDNGSCNLDDCPCVYADNILERIQQEQPEGDWEKELRNWMVKMDGKYALLTTDYVDQLITDTAKHFYDLRNRALEEAVRHVYESWMGGTMDDVRRDMVELGRVINARKEELPEIGLDKFTEKIKTFQGRYKHPEIVSIKGAMAFMARMFYQNPNTARQWYDSLPKATMD